MAKTPRARTSTNKASKKAAKKAAGKKASAKKATAKKASAKKATAKKAASKKATAKKATSEKASAKKATAKKASAKKAASEKASAKKATSKKASAKKAASKQAAAEKPAEKPAKKAASKAAAEKPAKKTAAKQAAADKPAKKTAAKKAAADKPAKKAPAKKAATDKPAAPMAEQLSLIETPAAEDSAAALPKALQPGDEVPDFSLEADDGQTYSKASLAGRRFVIYFYPKDDTPGCTQEACEFRDARAQLDTADVTVLGVSGDSLASHTRFRSKYQLDFPLLSDPDRRVATAFGALGEKSMYGKKRIGIIRSTFVVGADGVVERTFSPVRVNGHVQAVLQALGG